MDVPARVRGRDIGAGLVSIVKQVMQHPEYKWADFDKLLSEWLEWKITQLQKKENSEEAQQSAQDRVAAIYAVHSSRDHKTAEALIAAVEELFSDQRASVWLSTVHRAKGLEADRVFILKPHKLPLVWPSQRPAQREQEMNLKYVALTRSKDVLTFCYEEAPDGVKLTPNPNNPNNPITNESEKVLCSSNQTNPPTSKTKK
jgi:superfamily I DNA/RNA helicase